MSQYVVKFCEIPEFKLRVCAKKIVWFRSPVTANSTVSLNILGTPIELAFQGTHKNTPSTVQYQIPSSEFLSQLYEQKICIQVINCGKPVGFCTIEPKTLIQKPIIAPIISSHKIDNREVKLGDILIQFKLQRSKVAVRDLAEISAYLDSLKDSPHEFKKLYNKLRNDKLLI